ncbi:hypothetical protein BP5796_12397 [Coleophoma crateriformis]|uniref:Uncharacterized protein n=1 Tax=Coleophoma crateriformis TaxID=565419 RepID=A0A3D8Q9X7_9HELO|nr:hypothetical protein BP5796_12397 [Coleophoma crateriformis]
MLDSYILLLLQICMLLATVAAQQCYWPNGSKIRPGEFLACNATSAVSACCYVDDACTTYGWCLGGSGYVYRGGCTDKTWSSQVCQQSCMTDRSTAQKLFPCESGLPTDRFCCGTTGVSCCDNNFTTGGVVGKISTGAAFLPAARALVDLGLGSSTTTSAASSTTAEISSTAQIIMATTTDPPSSSGLAPRDVAGAAVGSLVAGIAVGAMFGWYICRKPSMFFFSSKGDVADLFTKKYMLQQTATQEIQPKNVQELGETTRAELVG